MSVLNRDRYYWGAKGGVTLSGGEPLMQAQFVVELLRHCNDAYIDVCVETSGCVSQQTLTAVLPYVQWFFIDVKHMDRRRHIEGTGADNELILNNIRWLAGNPEWSGRLILRMPVIPDFNDSLENAHATASFMKECGLDEISLLPFHRLGASKHHQLGMEYKFENLSATNIEKLRPLAEVYKAREISCYLGSNTPF
jgi:pyruvate-formate lyase-activating enzyme